MGHFAGFSTCVRENWENESNYGAVPAKPQPVPQRTLQCACRARRILHWREWPNFYIHTLTSHSMWAPRNGMFLNEAANPEAGHKWRLSTKSWGNKSFLEWMSGQYIFRSTTKIIPPLLVVEKAWKQQIKCLSVKNLLNQSGSTSSWNTIQLFK